MCDIFNTSWLVFMVSSFLLICVIGLLGDKLDKWFGWDVMAKVAKEQQENDYNQAVAKYEKKRTRIERITG